MHEATLVSARALSASVRELTFRASPALAFVPGQWVSFRVPVGEHEMVPRAYSIASPPRADGTFDIAVTRVDDGPGSTYLHAMLPGNSLAMTHAQGFFTLAPPTRPLLLVGTGTGISPLRAMLLAARDEIDVPVTLLFGVRSAADVLYGDEFGALASSRPWFRFEPTLSRGDASWTGRRGYVQAHVAELVRALGGDCDVYVCGLNRMVREVRRTLKDDVGFTRERIHTERYD